MQTSLAALALAVLGSTVARAGNGIYDFTMNNIDGKPVALSTYRKKVLLIVNVASKCGYTNQYKDLEALYRRYKEKGLAILGFPANNFLWQEPGTDAEIKDFCTTTYDVTFDMFSKISVKGKDKHPLYQYLTSDEANPATSGEVKWNFQKYLVGKNGKVLAKFDSKVNPMSPEIIAAIEDALGKE